MGRVVGLAASAAGLAGAVYLGAPTGWLACLPALVALIVLQRRTGGVAVGHLGALRRLGAIAVLAFGLGLGIGDQRIAAIDAGALTGPQTGPGTARADVAENGSESLLVRGWVTGSAWREGGQVSVPLSTPRGRVMVVTDDRTLPQSPPIGRLLEAEGRLSRPSRSDSFTRERLRRIGISHRLLAGRVEIEPARRGGIPGFLDAARVRAERGLAAGLTPVQADLARGFVLGGDDRIDPGLERDFRRTGLSHLVAASGQNVMLLAALAGVALGLLGLGLRARLPVTILLILLYVPLTGAGPSIQRAAVMGSAGLLATALGRPADRALALAAALALTLVINPRFTGDVGWQLSFAAVIGIGAWAPRIRALLLGRRPLAALPERIGSPVAEAVAITIAATIATAPLVGFTFERLSLVSLAANLLVAPAVAPVMWLGMVSSFIAQFAAWPLVGGLLDLLGATASVPIDWIAGVAERLASLDWAEAAVEPPTLGALALTYGCMAVGIGALLSTVERRQGLLPRGPWLILAPAAIIVVLVVLAVGPGGGPTVPLQPREGARVVVLDVGQGDATLLQPRVGRPILIDAGPPEAGVVHQLRDLGVEHLGALLITHDHLDHTGGAAAILARLQVDLLGRPFSIPSLDSIATSRSVRTATLRAGRVLRSGSLRLEVLWPLPRGRPADDPNASSLVLLARMSGRRILLTGDAEQEITGLRPGPVDLLKVAHHGSADAGLPSLLGSTGAAVATISSGADNTYGHPAPETTDALDEAGVCVLRTDRDGMVALDLDRGGIALWGEDAEDLNTRPGCGTRR